MSRGQRPVPRLWSPRLPVGRRWVVFCRSPFARHLRASAAGLRTTLAVVSGVLVLYVVLHGASVLQGLYTGGVQ